MDSLENEGAGARKFLVFEGVGLGIARWIFCLKRKIRSFSAPVKTYYVVHCCLSLEHITSRIHHES